MIEFSNVRKTYRNETKEIEVLKGISGKVEKGKILTLIGPSGSGKSTLLSMCNLLHTPDEGKVVINGKEIREWNIQELRRQVGIAFQAAPMIKGTALDNLALPAKLQGGNLENPEKYMDYVGLSTDLLLREAKELSGGERQRLSLARTLVNKPDILLLDEVTSALDTNSAYEVEQLILRINREKQTTILWVTHDLSQAERVGDQTWFMADGMLLESGLTSEFFSNPKDGRARDFIAAKKVYV